MILPMNSFDSKYDWKKLANPTGEGANPNAFDERPIYRGIRKKDNEIAKKNNNGCLLTIRYDPMVNRFHYAEILSKYFCISNNQLAEHIFRLENEGALAWSNLSSSVTEIVILEVKKYLAEKNIKANIITKKVEEDAIKKPGNDFA